MKPYYKDNSGVLYLGDCLEVMKELPDESVDMIFTDPPYGHNNNNGDLISKREEALGHGKGTSPKEEFRPIANDGIEANELIQKIFAEAERLLKPGGCCCCCCGGGGGPDPQFARWSLWLDEHLEFKQMVVWDKGPMGMGWHYRRSYETVLVAQKKGAACKWYDETHQVENIIRPGYKGMAKIIPSSAQHPTEKPQELASHFIQLHSQPSDLILEPFAGSGSTLRAAKDLGRKWIGIEIEKKYCDMIINRLGQEVLF
jgi:DNA modification methylase